MRYKVYVDTTDLKYHIPDDSFGIRIYFDEESLKKHEKCWEECGITQVILDCSSPKVIVEENFKLAMANAITSEEVETRAIVSGFKTIRKGFRELWWGMKSKVTVPFWRLFYKIRRRK